MYITYSRNSKQISWQEVSTGRNCWDSLKLNAIQTCYRLYQTGLERDLKNQPLKEDITHRQTFNAIKRTKSSKIKPNVCLISRRYLTTVPCIVQLKRLAFRPFTIVWCASGVKRQHRHNIYSLSRADIWIIPLYNYYWIFIDILDCFNDKRWNTT